jgi:hypothetical protein
MQQAQEQAGRAPGGDQVDVEQIMRDIRQRIAQRHGIELSTQQVQELAARRLEAILDPRTMNPALMEQLRRGAAAPPEIAPAALDPGYTFEDATLYESHRSVLRFMRRLLNPLLKLFFNPVPIVHAFKTQARLNREALAREAERERRQTEWNALHYDILQRLVTEVSRLGVEIQPLALRVESLSAKVDFNDRRVRSLETSAAPGRPAPPPRAEVVAAPAAMPTADTISAAAPATETAAADGTRRKRRRRRGRRTGGGVEGAPVAGAVATGEGAATDSNAAELNDGDDDDSEGAPSAPPVVAGFVSSTDAAAAAPEPEAATPPAPAPAPVPLPEPAAAPPVQPTPPRDEPSPAAPVDHADPGPPDR